MYNDTQFLDTGTMIERIGSYTPRWRKDKIKSTKEENIRKKSSLRIYSKRISLARSLVEKYDSDPSSFADERDMIKTTSVVLVENKLSPQVYVGWSDLLRMISLREGGWDYIISCLRGECSVISAAKRHARYLLGWNIFIFLVLSLLRLNVNNMVHNGTVGMIMFWSTMIITALFYVLVTGPALSQVKKITNEYAGHRDKKYKDFPTYEKVRALI